MRLGNVWLVCGLISNQVWTMQKMAKAAVSMMMVDYSGNKLNVKKKKLCTVINNFALSSITSSGQM